MTPKTFMRWAQTLFPFTRPLKFRVSNLLTRHLGLRMDADFRAIGAFRGSGLAIDIGGNWGPSIEAIKRCCGPQRILSFEPNPNLSRHLGRVYAADSTVEIQPCALSDQSGTIDLYIPHYRGFAFDGLASIDEEEARFLLENGGLAFFDPRHLSLERNSVPLRTLDSFNLDPAIVKIDVQGHEEQVIRGAMETYERCRPVSIIEAPGPEVVKLLAGFGMKPVFFDDAGFRPDRGSNANAIFGTSEQIRAMIAHHKTA